MSFERTANQNTIPLVATTLLLLLFFYRPAWGQQLPGPARFKEGLVSTQRNIATGRLKTVSLLPVHYKNKYYVLVQFDRLPDEAQKKELAGIGVRLFDYIPDRTFLAEVRDSFPAAELKKYSIGGISVLPTDYKLASRLRQQPDEELRDPDNLIAVSYFGSLDPGEVRRALTATGATVVPTKIQPPRMLFVRAATTAILRKITALPFVSYVASQPMTPKVLNYNNRAAHGADAVGTVTGRNLQGDGVVIGIGDDTDPYTHVDFTGREIDRFSAPPGGGHGVYTSGIAGGGGILDPMYKGMAPHSMILSQYFSDVLTNAPVYLSDYDMVLTSNSYTEYAGGCQNDGQYDALANFVDAQSYSYPNLLHSFASGNDGIFTCTPYPLQFATIKSGFQSAKNVLTIGNISNFDYTINYSSSSGPTSDGRLKPRAPLPAAPMLFPPCLIILMQRATAPAVPALPPQACWPCWSSVTGNCMVGPMRPRPC